MVLHIDKINPVLKLLKWGKCEDIWCEAYTEPRQCSICFNNGYLISYTIIGCYIEENRINTIKYPICDGCHMQFCNLCQTF